MDVPRDLLRSVRLTDPAGEPSYIPLAERLLFDLSLVWGLPAGSLITIGSADTSWVSFSVDAEQTKTCTINFERDGFVILRGLCKPKESSEAGM